MDWEFIEDGKTIDPLSVGMVREDGKEYYAEFANANIELANPWVKEHVLPNLKSYVSTQSHLFTELDLKVNNPGFLAKSNSLIKYEITNFLGDHPEFWGYFCDYDWVVFCQLWGRMVDLPSYLPMYCLDVKQEMYCKQISKEWIEEDHPQPTTHNALDDARWIRDAALWVWSY